MIIKQKDQLSLNVNLYKVWCSTWGDFTIQAPTHSAARYRVFKQADDAGCFRSFRDFLSFNWRVRLVRK